MVNPSDPLIVQTQLPAITMAPLVAMTPPPNDEPPTADEPMPLPSQPGTTPQKPQKPQQKPSKPKNPHIKGPYLSKPTFVPSGGLPGVTKGKKSHHPDPLD